MGWSVATMLYELADGPPESGSLLESILLMVAKRRQEADYYRTKALIAASVVDKIENGGKMLSEALDQYRDSLFPYLASETTKKDKASRRLLRQWTSKILKIRPLWRAQDKAAVISRLRRGAEKVKKAEEERRRKPHLRLV